ncbi:MAG: DUF4838 domain-containing protein [Clostridia bacterium]|nr:DUF4838 domain-containing protein [Clostridia bacterium]
MPLQLASGRKALAKIIVPPDATPQETYASTELRDYLDLITSAVFEITDAPYDGAGIAIGRAAFAYAEAEAGLGEDGFSIGTQPGTITVQGGKRGVIYGVYELLERLGCRFFTPECEKIPCDTELTAPDIETRQVPRLEFRDHNYYFYSTNPRFAVKSRMNGNFPPIPERMGGHMPYAWFVHTFDRMVPAAKYGKEHPEYFAEYDGKRCILDGGRTQLCLSNPDIFPIALKSVREALKANPEARIISVSQNDINKGCQCAACRRTDMEEGCASGTLLRFVNRIAEALEKEFPDVIFDTLAYNYTRAVPKLTRPRHNVCVRLCSIESCFAHPFETCDDERGIILPDGTRSSFINDLRNWGNYYDRLYIWDYVTCFAHYPAPFPNWRVLQPNMQAFVRNNVKGVFEQGNSGRKGGVDFNELRAYVISKLLWNADCDVARHIQEFTDYYYGEAGACVREYIDTLCDKADADDIHVGFNDQTDTPLYSEEMLDKLDAIMDKAEALVKGDPLRSWRVGKARLSVRWVRMKNRAMLENRLDPEEVTRFFSDWRAYGMGRIDEWVAPETTHRALLENRWRGVSYYEHWIAEGPEIY